LKNNQGFKTYKIFDDTEDKNIVKNKYEYAVFVENGLTLFEGIQNRQDFCIKSNVLYGTNLWCRVNKKIYEEEKKYELILLELLKNI